MMREAPFRQLQEPAAVGLRGKRMLVLGLGDTGLSVARYAEREGAKVRVADTRSQPPRAGHFAGELHVGPFHSGLLQDIDLVGVSPGVSLETPLLQEAIARGVPIIGDIELFAWQNARPVLAVTGTNGKSTVVSLAGHLLRAAGKDAEVAGNIGPAVLDALMQRETPPAAWVLELSSYQLETTWSLAPRAAVLLNVSEDHLDRYASVAEYAAAKARIFLGANVQIVNRDDRYAAALARADGRIVSFGLDAPRADDAFGLIDGWLCEGATRLLPSTDLGIHGLHNAANALAACALVRALDVPIDALREGLRSFKGLPHRLQLVDRRRGVDWYDDSKGTNVGATLAALKGLSRPVHLILGGEGKGQDFSPLAEVVGRFARRTLLIGRDAPLIEKALAGLPTVRCGSLEEAVERAAQAAQPGEAVLLSPACASFDMFRNYRHRGESFAAAVRALPA